MEFLAETVNGLKETFSEEHQNAIKNLGKYFETASYAINYSYPKMDVSMKSF